MALVRLFTGKIFIVDAFQTGLLDMRVEWICVVVMLAWPSNVGMWGSRTIHWSKKAGIF
jgi:hypothetical protein